MAFDKDCCCFSYFGIAVAAYLAFRFLRFVFSAIVSTHNDLKKYGAGKGGYAVITGCSGGIGKSFAVELAKRKMNLVLISRSAERLKPLPPPPLSPLHPVNNVGVNVDYPEFFADHTQKDFEDLLNTNIRSAHQMTHLLISKLASARGAAVINIASQSATLPSAPMLSVYAGTKGYLIAFSKALAAEYKSKKVDVVCITPSMVVSNMSKRRAGWDCPQPIGVVRPTLNSLGSGNVVFSPYVGHQLQDFIVSLLPESFIGSKLLGLHIATQKRAIQKRGERKK